MIVLVVDDEADARDTLRDVLEDEGYTVFVAASGSDAMRCLERVRPDVILLDLMMPLTSGNTVYEQLQKRPSSASIPILVVTAEPSRAPLGVPTLEKPIRLDKMLKLVELCCQGSQR
jgi:DNA-binding response OmpR family regulator